jgi:hypothetical protein
MAVEISAMLLSSLQQMLLLFRCISAQLSALRLTEVPTPSESPGFARNSSQVFFTDFCNTSESLIDAEYTKEFRVSQPKIQWIKVIDHAGQLNRPPRPIHSSGSDAVRQ